MKIYLRDENDNHIVELAGCRIEPLEVRVVYSANKGLLYEGVGKMSNPSYYDGVFIASNPSLEELCKEYLISARTYVDRFRDKL